MKVFSKEAIIELGAYLVAMRAMYTSLNCDNYSSECRDGIAVAEADVKFLFYECARDEFVRMNENTIKEWFKGKTKEEWSDYVGDLFECMYWGLDTLEDCEKSFIVFKGWRP